MSYKYVLYEKKDGIAYVILNRPEVYNAIHPPTSEELYNVWCDFRDDPQARVAILTGAGDRAFSAGNDLKYAAEMASQGQAPSMRPLAGGFGGNTSFFDCWKPMIAAVNGYALGGGFEIALACDIIIASERVQFGLPEVKRGLHAGAGGLHRLPRQIPFKIAMGYILTGRFISAQEAQRWGLVNEVVPPDQLMATAEKWALEIMENAPLSLLASKQTAMIGLGLPLPDAMARNYYWAQVMNTSQDRIEGARAFAEKRKPNWKGE
ncbi:MAG: enoyl-CoA hydratase/isomerase family protein [Chloroflexi bacterium]|nr:enoyl-CoA hydratase/isomerase family protein [Chloroflexota bacterium]